MNTKIVIGGPKGSGKSTLITSIFSYLLSSQVETSIHEIDVFSDTHDCLLGKKDWSQRKKVPTLVGATEETKKQVDEIVNERVSRFYLDRSDIVLGDLPGCLKYPIKKMAEHGDYAIVVGKHNEEIPSDWIRFFNDLGIEIICKIASVKGCLSESLWEPDISISGLDRSILVNREIEILAETIVRSHISFKSRLPL